jgi:hypothetical protein
MTAKNNTTLIVNNYCISKYFKIPSLQIQDNMFINDNTNYETNWINIAKDGGLIVRYILLYKS